MSAAKFVATTHDLSGSQKILQADFSAFDPLYSLESIHFEVLFVQDKSNFYLTVGKLRLLARVRDNAGERWFEPGDQDTKPGAGPQE